MPHKYHLACHFWYSFLEGRISRHWLAVAAPLLCGSRKFLLPPSWGWRFINKLHNIVHKQWIYCNSFIHYCGADGLTLPEHHIILNRIEGHAFTDPESLLPCHWFLLEADFASLGSGNTSSWLLWLANVDSDIAASTLSCVGTLTPESVAYFDTVPWGADEMKGMALLHQSLHVVDCWIVSRQTAFNAQWGLLVTLCVLLLYVSHQAGAVM